MHIRKLLLFICCGLFAGTLAAQDIHFSQFNMSPLTLNPAHTGKFEGTIRIGGILRGQWASVLGTKDQYKTPAFYADAPIIRGFRKNDWVGVGLSVFSDDVGIANLKHTGGGLNAAYHLALDKKGNTLLSVGFQYGGGQRRIKRENLRFEDGFKPDGSYVASQSQNYNSLDPNQNEVKYQDMGAGAMLSSRLNKRMGFNVGFSMGHINRPQYSLLGSSGTGSGSGARLPRRAILHGQFDLQLQPRFTVSPSFLYQSMSGADEIILQALAGYLFNPERDITLHFGVGYRMRDALHPIIGGRYKNLTVGMAYDVNTSNLSQATNFRGGFEIAANYIVKIYKPAVIKTKVLCPRF